MSLCTMKSMEEKLAGSDFIRIHRSFLVRRQAMDAIGTNTVSVGSKELPIGDAYRERLKASLSGLTLL